MPYAKSTWVNNTVPDIDATHLNNIEDGVSKAPYGPDGAANFVPVGDGSGGWLYQTIKNAQIDAAAAIAYSKLNLATSIVNADIAAGAAIALSKLASNPTGQPLALTGATAATRYAGATGGGAPASGTFAVGDFVIDQTGKVFICTVAGTPGTWVQVGAAGATTYRKTTAKTVNNTILETDLLNGEITIAAGVMATNGVARLTASGDFLNNAARVGMPRFKLKLGASTIFDTGVPGGDSAASASRGGWRFRAEIHNLGAANSQGASVFFSIVGQGNGGSGAGSSAAFTTGEGMTFGVGAATGPFINMGEAFNTAAVDTASSQALVLSVINSTANASYEVKLYEALVEIIA